MWVCVLVRWASVRRPARVRDAERATGGGAVPTSSDECRHLALRLDHTQRASSSGGREREGSLGRRRGLRGRGGALWRAGLKDGEAGRVVAAVLEPREPTEHDISRAAGAE
eukprot:scaffold137215_cov31-Tisochrysis_lutea.AAC.6